MSDINWSQIVKIQPSEDDTKRHKNSISMKKKLYISFLLTLLFIVLSIPYTREILSKILHLYISLDILVVLIPVFFMFSYIVLYFKL